MLATSALGAPGVCAYEWRRGQEDLLQPVAQLNHFGEAGATAAVLNCNNMVVACGCETGGVVLALPSENRAPLYEFTPMAGKPVRSLSFEKTSRYLAVAGDQDPIVVWDLKKKKKVRDLKGHTGGSVACLRFAPDGENVASGGASGTVLVHNIRSREVVATLDMPISSPRHMVADLTYSILSDSVLAVAYGDGRVAVFDSGAAGGNNGAHPVAEWALHEQAPQSLSYKCFGVSFSPLNHKFLASCGPGGKLVFLDHEQKRTIKVLETGRQLTTAEFIDGVYVAAGTASGAVLLYDLRSHHTPVDVLQHHALSHPVTDIHFHTAVAPHAATAAPASGTPVAAVLPPAGGTGAPTPPDLSAPGPSPPAPASHSSAAQPSPAPPRTEPSSATPNSATSGPTGTLVLREPPSAFSEPSSAGSHSNGKAHRATDREALSLATVDSRRTEEQPGSGGSAAVGQIQSRGNGSSSRELASVPEAHLGRAERGQNYSPQDVQLAVIKDMLGDMLMTTRKEIQKDVKNLHLDMIRQFEDQQDAVAEMLEQYSQRVATMAEENRQLRQDNERLRRKY